MGVYCRWWENSNRSFLCARLQGFPDSYQIVASDTKAYKQFRTSVACCWYRKQSDFPVDFPDAWKSTRRCPKALRHVDMYFEDELNQDNSEESMFRYLVLGYRFDRSGESEERLEYSGGSRIEAMEALRNVRQTGHGDIYIDVRGLNNWAQ